MRSMMWARSLRRSSLIWPPVMFFVVFPSRGEVVPQLAAGEASGVP